MPWYIHAGIFIVAVIITIPIIMIFNLPIGAKFLIVWPLYYLGVKIVKKKREEQQLYGLLKDCNYDLAAKAIISQFSGKVIPDKMSQSLDYFISHPCPERAAELIKLYPDLIVFFAESRPGGLFSRMGIPNSQN